MSNLKVFHDLHIIGLSDGGLAQPFRLFYLSRLPRPCRVFCDRAGILISCPASMLTQKVLQRKSNSPPCLCKKRRDKDGAAAKVD